jgi:hypothetical protein
VWAVDWHAPADPEAVFAGLDARQALVLVAGERLQVDDWGAARAELDAAAEVALACLVEGRPEVRIHPPNADMLAAIGGQSPHAVSRLSIVLDRRSAGR